MIIVAQQQIKWGARSFLKIQNTSSGKIYILKMLTNIRNMHVHCILPSFCSAKNQFGRFVNNSSEKLSDLHSFFHARRDHTSICMCLVGFSPFFGFICTGMLDTQKSTKNMRPNKKPLAHWNFWHLVSCSSYAF